MPGGARPKVQHYVPQFVLRQFVERKNQIWVFDKATDKKFRTNVRNIAGETGFYDFDMGGIKFSYEPSLTELETDASHIIKKLIRTESLSELVDEERLTLSRFLAVQFLRTRQWRDTFDSVTEQLTKALEERGATEEFLAQLKSESPESTKDTHMRALRCAGEHASFFLHKVWVLLKAPKKNPFWISDNPISLQNMNDYKPYGNLGLGVKGIEIYFPISRHLSLAMWCPTIVEKFYDSFSVYRDTLVSTPKLAASMYKNPVFMEQLHSGIEHGDAVPSSPENIMNHNHLQVTWSSRFVFASTSDFSLAEKMIASDRRFRKGLAPTIG